MTPPECSNFISRTSNAYLHECCGWFFLTFEMACVPPCRKILRKRARYLFNRRPPGLRKGVTLYKIVQNFCTAQGVRLVKEGSSEDASAYVVILRW